MKKKKKTVPTLIGLVVLILSLATGVILVKSEQLFRLRAEPKLSPKDIRISNITNSSASISWTTNKRVQGFIVWGEKKNSLSKTALSSSGEENYIHLVTLEELAPESTYYFKINSGGREFDNDGIPWQIKTCSQLPDPPFSNIVFGTILTSSGAPAKGVIIYVTVGGSSLLSTLSLENGSWTIPISQARTQDLSSYITIDESSTLLEITVQGGPLGVASAQIYPKLAKPAPEIFLGKTHNFKALSPQKESEIPDASVVLPEKPTSSP